jgi:hypothetical protein
MPDNHIKIFIASSGELIDERKQCVLLINQLNKSHKHLRLEPIEWEYDMVHSSYPGYETVQGAINPLLQQSDLAVFIFYSKLGPYTREEFDYATAQKKKLFAYFKTGFSPGRQHLDTYGSLLDFKESLNSTVLYKEYKDLTGFEKELFPNLNLYLAETYPPSSVDTVSSSALSQSNLALISMLGEKDAEIKRLNENLLRLPGAEIEKQLEQLLQEKEAIQKRLLQSEEIIKQQAEEKEALQKQLATQTENNTLKAKALEEVQQGNYSEAKQYLKKSAKGSIDETASTFYELAKLKNWSFTTTRRSNTTSWR